MNTVYSLAWSTVWLKSAAPTCARLEQPGELAAMGRGGLERGKDLQQTDPAEHRLLGLPLVPCDGPRELRGSRDRRVDEPRLRQHQSGSRRAARSRRALPQAAASNGSQAWVAAHDVSYPRRRALLGRNLFSARRAERAAVIPRSARICRRRLPVGPAGRRTEGTRVDRRPDAPATECSTPRDDHRRKCADGCGRGARANRSEKRWARRGAEVSLSCRVRVPLESGLAFGPARPLRG